MTKLNQNRWSRYILMAMLLLAAVAILPNTSFAQNISKGCSSSGSPFTLNDSQNWQTLCSQTVTFNSGTHDCVGIGSAQMNNTVIDGHNIYRFTVSKTKNPDTDTAWERRIDVLQGDGLDPIEVPVSTVHQFKDLTAGTYTFYWLGRKDEGAENLAVTQWSMGLVCTDGN